MADLLEIASHVGTGVASVLASLVTVRLMVSASHEAAKDAKALAQSARELAVRLEERAEDLERRAGELASDARTEKGQRHGLSKQFADYLERQGQLWVENARTMAKLEERTRDRRDP